LFGAAKITKKPSWNPDIGDLKDFWGRKGISNKEYRTSNIEGREEGRGNVQCSIFNAQCSV
jgi:hypothetical protein